MLVPGPPKIQFNKNILVIFCIIHISDNEYYHSTKYSSLPTLRVHHHVCLSHFVIIIYQHEHCEVLIYYYTMNIITMIFFVVLVALCSIQKNKVQYVQPTTNQQSESWKTWKQTLASRWNLRRWLSLMLVVLCMMNTVQHF